MVENTSTRSSRKVRVGVVVSDARDKTVTVEVPTSSRHPRYDKIVRISTKSHAHDENNDAHVGDTVRIMETRPLSKQKRWRVVEVLERAR
jgi:small subunit ribosomal protein S17